MKFLLGVKKNMDQRYTKDGRQVPITIIQAGVCTVTQVRTKDHDGYTAVQIGYGTKKTLTKALSGHLKGLAPVRHMQEIRCEEGGLKRGDTIDVASFKPGEKITVQGLSKGRGFAGVVKRHGFHGHPPTHGHKDQERHSGAIGAGGVQHVRKGMRMGGRMGQDFITVKGLEILEVDEANQQLMVKGAIPGSRGTLILVTSAKGTMSVVKKDAVQETIADAPASVSQEPGMVSEATS